MTRARGSRAGWLPVVAGVRRAVATRPRGPALAAVVVAAVVASVSLWHLVADPDVTLANWPTTTSFFVAIAVGEYYRFTVQQARELAPMSLAAALAFALTSSVDDTQPGRVLPTAVLGVTAVAMAAGALPHLLQGRFLRSDEVAARFLGVGVVAVLYRQLPVWESQTLLELEATWTGDRWRIALLMSAMSGVGLLTYLTLTAVATAMHEHRGLWPTFTDQLRTGAGLGLALGSTGTLIALAVQPLGVFALPLFLLPLVLTQFALRQYAAISATYGQTVRVLSRLTETAGFIRPGHSDRVAALSVAIGRDLGLSDKETRHLEYAALLHDIGQVALRAPIPAGATVMAAPADQARIATDSADIVRKTGVAPEVADAVALQSVPYRVVREDGDQLPLLARIVKVANAYDDFVGGSITARRREAAIERIQLGLGYEYDPRVVDALLKVLSRSQNAAR